MFRLKICQTLASYLCFISFPLMYNLSSAAGEWNIRGLLFSSNGVWPYAQWELCRNN